MKRIVSFGIVAAVALVGCGKEEVSFASLEEAKQMARDNALFNAQAYRQSNPRYSGWDILGRGDSTQTNTCPQGMVGPRWSLCLPARQAW